MFIFAVLFQLQVYERALKCIPEPDYSVDKEAAIFVTVHLLLTRYDDHLFCFVSKHLH